MKNGNQSTYIGTFIKRIRLFLPAFIWNVNYFQMLKPSLVSNFCSAISVVPSMLPPIGMKRIVVILLYLVISKNLFSQQIKVARDFGIWGGVNIEKEISKKTTINLEQQLRFYSNVTKFDDYIIDFGSKYKINKNFKLGANIRYIHNVKRWTVAENNYRYNLDLLYKGKLSNKLKIYYRLRYQKEYVNLLSEYEEINIHSSSIRNRIKAQFRANKINKLFISAELHRLIEMFKEPYFNLIRFHIGDNIKTKIGEFNCSIGYTQEINTNYPLSFFFLKTIYTLKL